jgi:hypothetical protein
LFFAPTRRHVDFDPGQDLAQIMHGIVEGLYRGFARGLTPAAISDQAAAGGFP